MGKKTAKVVATRKLLTVCWSVWRNRRPYFTLFTVRRRELLVAVLPRFGRGRSRD